MSKKLLFSVIRWVARHVRAYRFIVSSVAWFFVVFALDELWLTLRYWYVNHATFSWHEMHYVLAIFAARFVIAFVDLLDGDDRRGGDETPEIGPRPQSPGDLRREVIWIDLRVCSTRENVYE